MESVLPLLGLIATIWISLGVYIAAKFYPNYSHINQFCSELGAAGSPTEKLSPRINNYPLGVIFSVFGWYLTQIPNADGFLVATGILIIIHGIGTWLAGFFPMDKDPYTTTPSTACNMHSWAGFAMLIALLVAPVLIAFSSSPQFTLWFKAGSVATVVVAVFFMVKTASAYKTQKQVGLYQRLCYWVKLLWLSALSIQLIS